MYSLHRLAAPALVALLGLAAAPAQATQLVRSDSNGLFVFDKNGLDDKLEVHGATLSGESAYRIRTLNFLDVFKFDRREGCFEVVGQGEAVVCRRVNSFFKFQLGSGNDELRFFDPPHGISSVSGGPGNDEVRGLFYGGKHQFFGDAGDDTLTSGFGADVLLGGDGNDTMDAQREDDTLEGGNGRDRITGGLGRDVLRGNPGNDRIISKEPGDNPAVADDVGCGGGNDFLEADLKDVVPPSCEEFDRSPVGETPHVKLPGTALRVSSTGEVRVRLRCPRGVKGLGCNGRLQLRLASAGGARASRSRKVSYRIKAGRPKSVTLRLAAKDVRTLRRRSAKKRRGSLVSVENGRKGRKTTVRNARLTLRGR